MKRLVFFLGELLFSLMTAFGQKAPVDYVNPFIGTTHSGNTNPGALCPQGMMSVAPFNVKGDTMDYQIYAAPYDYSKKYLTGFSHVNLSGVDCPDMSSLLLMATTGNIDVDYHSYGSTYTDEVATPGYYSNRLEKYGVRCEMTATPRTSMARFTFPKGKSNILMNLGEALTTESGATVKLVNDREIEGSKLLGSFCRHPEATFPIYFVMRINKVPSEHGYWKRMMSTDNNSGSYYKLYRKYSKELSGDDIGAYFTFNTDTDETIEVSIGVSFVSTENARMNLEKEQPFGTTFDKLCADARKSWNDNLSRILVKGGTEDQKTIFYTALYHFLIHPNILQDVSGQYPQMEGEKILTTNRNRYTVFSLWNTYRNVHPLMTILFPDRQLDMVNSMIDMYREYGWLPKWELYGRETNAMSGDPATIVVVDTYMKGLTDFDVDRAYRAMFKSATMEGKKNMIRPDIDDYLSKGYIPMKSQYDHSVSRALEYYLADNALISLAKKLKRKEDVKQLGKRTEGYKYYYRKDFGMLAPLNEDGKFYEPFDSKQEAAWNYTFFVPYDIKGLAGLMGQNRFIAELQNVFDKGYYDPANEQNLAYPYFFSRFSGEGWRTQQLIKELLKKHYTNKPDGLPGNDDSGAMSAWAVFSMMGFYPDCPGEAKYTLTTPIFDEITIQLDNNYWKRDRLVIKKEGNGDFIKEVYLGKHKVSGLRVDHHDLIDAGKITFVTSDAKK
ncbi:MAG: GH92 family glycosyl hydrolase [Phocaeicola sp.]|uniref:GH92 family glycosyl hydrolase n=1 Tax=Phocaeicola sp. TaxID=2773926 RepID=UPI003F9F9AF9